MELSQREKRIQQTLTNSKDMIQNLLTPRWPTSWESFIGFCIWWCPISTILASLFNVAVRISWKKFCWKVSKAAEMPSRASYLMYYNVLKVDLSKLFRTFVWVFKTETTNCRVSFIVLYVVFPNNFRILILPDTNTVILLEPYCGTVTEPGYLWLQVRFKYTLVPSVKPIIRGLVQDHSSGVDFLFLEIRESLDYSAMSCSSSFVNYFCSSFFKKQTV